MEQVRRLKRELIGAIISVFFTVIALTAVTYAWYAANNKVKGTTATISATTNGFILQIATAEEGAQHGGEQKKLAAATEGHKISPSSTNDISNWYACKSWDSDGIVNAYTKLNITDSITGRYTDSGKDYYAYICSEYILYTINETGKADVYLDTSDGEPITVNAEGTATSQTIPNSLRIGITTVDTDGNETLKVVYAPSEVKGKGNDVGAIEDKWTYIDGTRPAEVTYSHIYKENYTDQNGGIWAAVSSGKDFLAPESNGRTIADHVGYDGVKMRVYIWMEGTDADCVNNSEEEDLSTYSVTVKLAGVATE